MFFGEKNIREKKRISKEDFSMKQKDEIEEKPYPNSGMKSFGLMEEIILHWTTHIWCDFFREK